MALYQLDTSVRYSFFALGNLLLLTWTYKVVARAERGWSRFFWSTPSFVLCYTMFTLFDYANPSERNMAVHAALNYLWLCPWKLLAFSMNRGCLQKAMESRSLSAFSAALLFNVNVFFEVKPKAAEKKDDDASTKARRIFNAYDDVRFSVVKYRGKALFNALLRVVMRLCLQVVVMLIACYFFIREEIPFIRDVAFLWHAYMLGSILQDVSHFIILTVLNIKLEDSFHHPYLSDSFSDFWARRWNKVMASQLRDLCYEPIVEGQWIAPREYLAKRKKPVIRRLIGIAFTFIASALIHWFVLEGVSPTNKIPIRYMGLFFLNALVIGFEVVLRTFVRRSKSFAKVAKSIPRALRILMVHLSLLTMAHYLFLPDLHDCGFVEKSTEPSTELLKKLSLL